MKRFSVVLFLAVVFFFVSSITAWNPPLEPGQVCRPNESFYIDCNKCRCSEDGSDGACTRKACPPNNCSNEDIYYQDDDEYCVCRNNSWYCPSQPMIEE